MERKACDGCSWKSLAERLKQEYTLKELAYEALAREVSVLETHVRELRRVLAAIVAQEGGMYRVSRSVLVSLGDCELVSLGDHELCSEQDIVTKDLVLRLVT